MEMESFSSISDDYLEFLHQTQVAFCPALEAALQPVSISSLELIIKGKAWRSFPVSIQVCLVFLLGNFMEFFPKTSTLKITIIWLQEKKSF